MATPRVFVSSTCYDLKYIRENLKYFVRNLGYEPVLSEDGNVFFDPAQHTHDSCLTEVPNCQIFVLIIGGRFGGQFNGRQTSITNEEYREAVRRKIPIFALVEQGVYSDHLVYVKNKGNKSIDASKLIYPSIEKNATNIFDFIDEVRLQVSNNALVPFRNFSDIESYLRQQWAGMMFSFLLRDNENARVGDTMRHLIEINEKVAFISKQLLNTLGTRESNVLAKLYELMIGTRTLNTLISTGYKPTPISILTAASFENCTEILGEPIKVIENADFITSSSGEIDAGHLETVEADFEDLKTKMLGIVRDAGLTVENLNEIEDRSAKRVQ